MSNLIICGSEWPFERLKFDPTNPGDVPSETLQWINCGAEGADEHCLVRYVVRSEWRAAESGLSIEYREEDQIHLPEGCPPREDVKFWGWGTHILTIKLGENRGPSRWKGVGFEWAKLNFDGMHEASL